MKFLKNKVFIFVCIVVVVSLLSMALSARGGNINPIENVTGIIVTSLQKITTGFQTSIATFTSYFTDFNDLKAENEELKQQVLDLQEQLRDYDKSKTENEELKDLLGLKESSPDFTFATAEIISRDVNNWFTGFVIDKGTMDGVKQYAPVITNAGLVGHVSEVGTNWAKVSTIIEPDTTVGAIVTRSRDTGVVEGSFDLMEQGLCRMSYIPKTAGLLKGDYVETSGLGGIYPKGLIIGTIEEVGLESHGISQYAVVRPTVELGDISMVFVITNFEQAEDTP